MKKRNNTHTQAPSSEFIATHFQVMILIARQELHGGISLLSPNSPGADINTPGLGLLTYKLPVMMQEDKDGNMVCTPGLEGLRLFWEWMAKLGGDLSDPLNAAKLLAYENPDRGSRARLSETMRGVGMFWPGGVEFQLLDPDRACFGMTEEAARELNLSGEEIFQTGIHLDYREAEYLHIIPEIVRPDGEIVDGFFNPFYSPDEMGIPVAKLPPKPAEGVLRYADTTVSRRKQYVTAGLKAGGGNSGEEPEWMSISDFFRGYDGDPASWPMLVNMTRPDGFGGRRFTFVGRSANEKATFEIKKMYGKALLKCIKSFSSKADFVSEEELQAETAAVAAAAETADIG